MIVTVDYYIGYLTGGIAGFLLGWIFSGFSNEEEDTSLEVEDDSPLPAEVVVNSPLPTEEVVDKSSGSENVIYIRLTDQGLVALLNRIKEDSVEAKSSDTSANCTGLEKGEDSPVKKTTNTLPEFSEIGADEMTGIFDEEDRLKGKTVDEKLDIGRKMPVRPVAFPTSIGGGYATMGQIEDMRKKHEEYKEAVLSRSEELEIISAFRGIVGKNFYDAQSSVKEQGYTLHVLYVGATGTKRSAQYYSATTLGVRIEDDSFESGIPSVNAKIVEIVDVGGIDPKNKGAPRN